MRRRTAQSPLVSAIVSTYNAESFIRGKLEDLEAQTIAEHLEIIVIDSGSQQNERAVVEEFQLQYPNIRYLRTERRETVYQAWNRGIREARGEFVTNANTDDRLRRDCYEILVRALREHPECVLAYGDMRVTQQENATFDCHQSYGVRQWPDFDRNFLIEVCCIGPFPLWRRSLHDDIGHFDERYRSAADYDFWLRAALEHDFIHVPQFLGLYWLSPQTVSRKGELPTVEYLEVQKEHRPRYAPFAPAPATVTAQEEQCFRTLLTAASHTPEHAFAGLERFAEQHPRWPQAHHDLADIYYKMGEVGYAKKHYELATLADPASELHRERLRAFLHSELSVSLREYLAHAVAKPDDLETQLILGMICMILERYDAARKHYLRAFEIDPDHAPARENLAFLEQLGNGGEEGTAAACPAASESAGSAEAPANSSTEKVVAEAARLAHQGLNQAADLILQPGCFSLADGGPRPLLVLAELLMDSGKAKDAPEVMAMPPVAGPLSALLLQGRALLDLGQQAAALEQAEQALRLAPGSAEALQLMGAVLEAQGEKGAADKFYKKALLADPNCGPAFTGLAALAWERGEHAPALQLAETGFILSPLSMSALARYHCYATACGALRREEVVVRRASAQHPDHRGLAYGVIEILIRDGRYKEAMEAIESAAGRFPLGDAAIDAALEIRRHAGDPPPVRKGTGSISVCMIVKNEARDLPAALLSLRGVADEIVIVDTGSTDRTGDVARIFGARLFTFTWTDSFSEARNYSLSKALGDWILIHDPDEVLAARDRVAIRELLQNTEGPVAYSFPIRNYTDQVARKDWSPNSGEYPAEERGQGWTPSARARLFPNDSRIRFAGVVHELLEPSLAACGIPVRSCNISVHHYGKLDQARCAGKYLQYFELGIKKLAESGGSLPSVLELARQATELGKLQEGERLWQRVLDADPACSEAYLNLGYLYLTAGNYPQARRQALTAVALAPEMKEAFFNLGKSELFLGMSLAAQRRSEEMLHRWPDYPPALSLLCVTSLLTGNREAAEAIARKIATMGFDCQDFILEYASGLKRGGRDDLAAPLLAFAALFSTDPDGGGSRDFYRGDHPDATK